MARLVRKVIAVDIETGVKKEFASVYELAKVLGSSTQNVTQIVERNGIVRNHRLYDTPEMIRRRIADLQRQLTEIE